VIDQRNTRRSTALITNVVPLGRPVALRGGRQTTRTMQHLLQKSSSTYGESPAHKPQQQKDFGRRAAT
jgi:hypothetical protein